MNGIHASKDVYELLEICGQTVLFTNARLDRETVPEGIYAYDLRHDDLCQGNICEIKPFVMVNHWGTILCREPMEMTDGECLYVSEDDYGYLGESVTLEEFLHQQNPSMEMGGI